MAEIIYSDGDGMMIRLQYIHTVGDTSTVVSLALDDPFFLYPVYFTQCSCSLMSLADRRASSKAMGEPAYV